MPIPRERSLAETNVQVPGLITPIEIKPIQEVELKKIPEMKLKFDKLIK